MINYLYQVQHILYVVPAFQSIQGRLFKRVFSKQQYIIEILSMTVTNILIKYIIRRDEQQIGAICFCEMENDRG